MYNFEKINDVYIKINKIELLSHRIYIVESQDVESLKDHSVTDS